MYRKQHPYYATWKLMRQRCLNPLNHKYPNYGGRGINICGRWNEFWNFVEDMGEKPSPEHTLDRKDRNGNYCLENCKWSTLAEQSAIGRREWVTNTTGVMGVSFDHRDKAYSAKGRNKTLYRGKDFFEACCIRKSWENHNGMQA